MGPASFTILLALSLCVWQLAPRSTAETVAKGPCHYDPEKPTRMCGQCLIQVLIDTCTDETTGKACIKGEGFDTKPDQTKFKRK